MPSQMWPCAAYYDPTEPAAVKLAHQHCFFELSVRCRTEAECAGNLHSERRLLWRRLQELAAAGDEVAALVLDGLTGPDELLGGPAS